MVHRPADPKPLGWALALGALALIMRLPLMAYRHEPPLASDTTFYLKLSDDLAHGRGFDAAGEFYTPGYPAVMTALRPIPGRVEDALTVAQHLIGVGVTAALVLMGWRLFGRGAAIGAGAIAALSPLLATSEHALLPDFLFGAVVLAGALLLAEAVTRERAPWLLLAGAGVAFGAATWIKPAGQFLIVAAPLALLLATRDRRATLRGTAIVSAALVISISPWLARNLSENGSVGMSNQGGLTLFNRVFEVDGTPFPAESRYAPLAARVRARIHGHHDLRFNSAFHVALVREEGLTSEEALSEQGHLALTAIRHHPGAYAVGTAREMADADVALQEYSPEVRDLRNELAHVDPAIPRWPTTLTWVLMRVPVLAWWIASLAGAAALAAAVTGPERSRRAAITLIVVWLTVAGGTALSHGELWRYSMQVAPIGWLVGCAGIGALASALRRRRA